MDDEMDSSFDNFSTQLYVKGDNSAWQCGVHSIAFIERMHKVTLRMVIREIACGLYHTLILTNEGSVYGMGANDANQLGVSNVDKHHLPILIMELQQYNCTKVAAGESHSVALTDDRKVYKWGDGENTLKFLKNADNIKCGLKFIVLQDEEQLYLHNGGITQPLIVESVIDFACSADEMIYLDQDKQVHVYGEGHSISGVASIFDGFYVSLLKDSGELYYFKDKQWVMPPIDIENIVDCAFSSTDGVFLDDASQSYILNFDDNNVTQLQLDTDIRCISSGVRHVILVGSLLRSSRVEEDSVIESPITMTQIIPIQNNTFSFSMRKDFQLFNYDKMINKETQTDQDSIQLLAKENEELRRQLSINKKHSEMQIQFQSTLQDQISRLQKENQHYKLGQGKQQILNLIRYKQANLKRLISEFYAVNSQH